MSYRIDSEHADDFVPFATRVDAPSKLLKQTTCDQINTFLSLLGGKSLAAQTTGEEWTSFGKRYATVLIIEHKIRDRYGIRGVWRELRDPWRCEEGHAVWFGDARLRLLLLKSGEQTVERTKQMLVLL